MNIDKFYRFVGETVKSLFKKTVQKPIQRFNVENRAQRAITKKKSAPWHETTQKLMDEVKQSDSVNTFKQSDSKNNHLLDRLRSVKVDSYETNPDKFISDRENFSQIESKLPQDRFGLPLPYVFYKPETMPKGKITVLDILDIILSYRQDKRSIDDICLDYGLSKDNVTNLVNYLDVFKAINERNEEIQLFSKRDSYDSETMIDSGAKSAKKPKELDDR